VPSRRLTAKNDNAVFFDANVAEYWTPDLLDGSSASPAGFQ